MLRDDKSPPEQSIEVLDVPEAYALHNSLSYHDHAASQEIWTVWVRQQKQRRGSKYLIFTDSGPANDTLSSFGDQSPYNPDRFPM